MNKYLYWTNVIFAVITLIFISYTIRLLYQDNKYGPGSGGGMIFAFMVLPLYSISIIIYGIVAPLIYFIDP